MIADPLLDLPEEGTRSIDHLLIAATRLWAGDALPAMPLAFVDLDRAAEWPDTPALPPFPVIGVGDRAHPLAPMLDAVIVPPVTAARIAAHVSRAPLAAAATVRLLRVLPRVTLEDGLAVESATYAMLQGSAEHAGWRASRRDGDPGEPGGVRLMRDGGRLTITLDRPRHGNAIDRPMRDGLYDALALGALDPAITRVSLRGEGRAFSLGADLAEFGTTCDPATAHAIRARTLPALAAARCAAKLDAHIDGACVGAGLELAAFAHRITSSPRAWFQLPELAMGILPGAGGCVSLTRRIGRQATALMILSGQRLGARQALAWGLVDAIVDQAP